MKRHKNKQTLRRKLEKFGIWIMILASSGLMLQLIINILFINNNVVMAYSRKITKTAYEVKAEIKTEAETEKNLNLKLKLKARYN